MSTKVKFKVSDKLVKARDGASYDIKNYVEGVDYVMRGCFKGQKAVFRSDILGISVVDPSKVEHKQEPKSLDGVMMEVESKGLAVSIHDPSPDDWRPPVPEEPLNRQMPVNEVQQAKIVKIHANFKWVETDKGRVWVGLKGQTLRVNQVIRVKNGELYLKKI